MMSSIALADSLGSWPMPCMRLACCSARSSCHRNEHSVKRFNQTWHRRYCLRLWRTARTGQSPSIDVKATLALYLRPARLRQEYIEHAHGSRRTVTCLPGVRNRKQNLHTSERWPCRVLDFRWLCRYGRPPTIWYLYSF